MTRNQKIFAGIDAIVASKDLDRDLIVEGIEDAIVIALKKTYDYDIIEVKINYDSKRILMNGKKVIVADEDFMDDKNQIKLSEAIEKKKASKVGEEYKEKLVLDKNVLERAVVQSSKQVFRQKLKEAEYKKILENYGDKVGEVVKGRVEEIKEPFIYFKLKDGTLATLGPKGRIENENLEPDLDIDLIIEMIGSQSKKGPKIIVSRTSPKIVEKAMEEVIPEIESKIIGIKNIAREAGSRSKVAVELLDLDKDVDVVGTCVGTNGQRINQVKAKLSGENIDLIEYFDDEVIYIANALAPALITAVQIVDKDKKLSRIIVPDDQFSLAIGINGQNARLASNLTGWKIDIKSESQAKKEGINYEEDII